MPKSITIQKPQRKPQLGDMRDLITLRTRTLTVPLNGGIDLSETFTKDICVWSLLQTKAGVEIFDGTNLKGVATHYFYIRFIKALTTETFVKYVDSYYEIIDIQNLDGRNEFMLLRCQLKGISTNATNTA